MTNKSILNEEFPTVVGEREAGQYTVSDAINKALTRGCWGEDSPEGRNEFITNLERVSPVAPKAGVHYDDYDAIIIMSISTSSSWTNSPRFKIQIKLPVHVDRRGRMSTGFHTSNDAWEGVNEEEGRGFRIDFQALCPETGNLDTISGTLQEYEEEYGWEATQELERELVKLWKEFHMRGILHQPVQ